MHPTQHSTITSRRRAIDEAIRQMAENLQHLGRVQNQVVAQRLHLAPAPLHQPSTISHQQPPSAACLMLAASPMAENPWHVAAFIVLLILGHVAALIFWAHIVAPREQARDFVEPETDAQITAAPNAVAPSCAHLTPLRDHCPYCAGHHQPLAARHA